jgi:hypothetical protein
MQQAVSKDQRRKADWITPRPPPKQAKKALVDKYLEDKINKSSIMSSATDHTAAFTDKIKQGSRDTESVKKDKTKSPLRVV